MSDNPLSSRVSIDTSEFKAGITALNRQVRVIESGFRAASAGLGDWAKSASGLEMRIGALTDEMGVQQRKVGALKEEYERLRSATGENSISTEKALIEYNKAREALGKMESELGETRTSLDKMGDESKDTGKSVDGLADKERKAERATMDWKGALGGLKDVLKATAGLVAGVAAAAAGAVLAIGGMILKAADTAGELVDLSNQTGISVEKLQEMKYIGEQTGTSLDTMTDSMAKLTRNMSEAGSNKELAATFKKLGVSVLDTNGELRDNEAVFGDLLTALGKVPNEAERDALAMQIFGKSAQELNPLIKAGADEMNRLADEAHKVGAVMDTEAVEGLEGLGDALAGMKAGLLGTLGTLAASFLPGLQGFVGQAQGLMEDFATVAGFAGSGDFESAAFFLQGLLQKIIRGVTEQAPALLEAGLKIIQGIINAVVTAVPAMLPGVITMITTLLQFIIQNLPLLLNAGIEIIMALVKGIAPQLPMLLEMAIEMIVTLAEGLAEAIPQLLPVIAELIPKLILTLVENLPLLVSAALLLIEALVDGLVIALPILIEYTPEILEALVDALMIALPMIAVAAVEIVTALVDGLTNNEFKLSEKAKGLIENIKKTFTETLPTLLAMGKQIVDGIWQGIQAQAEQFGKNVKAFFENIIKSAKEALGIQSPSAVFNAIGQNMALGLGIGFGGAMERVAAEMRGLGNALTPSFALTPALSPRERGREGRGNVYVTVNATIASELDVYEVAWKVAEVVNRRR